MNSYKDDVLYHYGIKGQQYGKRRFQYEDGRLTPAGKERYGGKSSKRDKVIILPKDYKKPEPKQEQPKAEEKPKPVQNTASSYYSTQQKTEEKKEEEPKEEEAVPYWKKVQGSAAMRARRQQKYGPATAPETKKAEKTISKTESKSADELINKYKKKG